MMMMTVTANDLDPACHSLSLAGWVEVKTTGAAFAVQAAVN
jgi:hypothetical protein